MNLRPLFIAAAIGAAALSATAVPAIAGDKPDGRTSVSYSDLDLSSEAGRAELNKRFEQAAREMCGVSDTTKLSGKARYCYEQRSKQLEGRVAAILAAHDEARGG